MLLPQERPRVRNDARDGGGGRGQRACQERPSALALTSFKVAVGSRDAVLAGLQLVSIHSDTHGAAGLAPLRAGLAEDPVQSLRLGLAFDRLRARNHQHAHLRVHFPSLENRRRGAQIADPRVRATADEDHVHALAEERLGGLQIPVTEWPGYGLAL